MSGKASVDFGLYKEKEKQDYLKPLKLVFIAAGTAFFIIVIFYIIMCLTRTPQNFEPEIKERAEKLIPLESVKKEAILNTVPKPFGVVYRGQAPSEFTSTTEKVTTLNYPQLNGYRQKYYPQNIQDVIGYSSRVNQPLLDPLQYNRNYKESPSQRFLRNFTQSNDDYDPFYQYKPQDPSDINLLATASFRFAPPIWGNNRQHAPKFYPQSQQPSTPIFPQQQQPQQQLEENTNRQEIFKDHNYFQRPLALTVNVYPENQFQGQHRYGLGNLFSRIENLDPRYRLFGPKPKKMVIHLNLYPEHYGYFKEDARETKVHQKVAPKPKTTEKPQTTEE